MIFISKITTGDFDFLSDLDQTFYDLDLNLLYENIKINAVILIFDLNFARSLRQILIFRVITSGDLDL